MPCAIAFKCVQGYDSAAFAKICTSDPAMLGGILAIDMGGYQMAVDLAAKPRCRALRGNTGCVHAGLYDFVHDTHEHQA